MNKDKEVEAYRQGNLTTEEQTKYEIARELGILDKVLENGWKSLSAKETGRIGGMMAKKKPKQPSQKPDFTSGDFPIQNEKSPTIRPVNLPSEDSNGKINTNNF